jgi:cytoskeletal protein CcmA (bactofilin family)
VAGHPRNFWRSLTGHSAAKEDIQLVLDRRQGERRQQVQSVEEERRMADRRGPQTIDLSEVRGFLGEGIHVKGELRFGGAIRLEGYLEGEIVQGEILIIGERGRVNAEVDVGILQVRGEVHGNITASQRVELLGGGRITGTIRTPCLVIWKGAVFNGKCEMPSPQGTQAGGAERNREGGRPPGQA